MYLNPNLYPALIISGLLFVLGYRIRQQQAKIHWFWVMMSIVSTITSFSFSGYYIHFINEPFWYISFRAIPYIELLSGSMGFAFGYISGIFKASDRILTVFLFAFSCLITLVPFLKPIIKPIPNSLQHTVKESVTIQTAASTCGVSSLATICRYYGLEFTEHEIAVATFPCNSSTELWYLLRFSTQQNLNYQLYTVHSLQDIKIPSLIGTYLGTMGHFITILGKTKDAYIVGDSLLGKLELTEAQFKERYRLSGLGVFFELK